MKSPTNSPEMIAQFRYTVIAPLVSRPLAFGELRALIAEQAARVWTRPDGTTDTVHVRTIYRWLQQYRQDGLAALTPQVRQDQGTSAVDPAIIARALALRAEDPHRSARQILTLLEWAGEVLPGTLAYSTLTRHLRDAGAQPFQLKPSAETFRRRQAPYRNAEWQGDTQLTLRLPDPTHPDRKKKVYLIALIDDATRYLVGSRFFFEENRPRLEEVLKWAIVRYGIPEILHVDNGSIYASHYLARVCAELGIDLRHAKPYRPAGKGKIERFFRRVDQQLTFELQALIDQGRCTTLDDLNGYWEAWVQQSYHTVLHRSLGTTPQAAWEHSEAQQGAPRHMPLATLQQIFLWQEERKVDKTGVIALAGNRYEVDLALVGHRILCRYDPYTLEAIHVSYQGQAYADAVPLVLRHHRHREVPTQDLPPRAPATGLNLAQLAHDRKEQADAAQQARVHYAQPPAKPPRPPVPEEES